MRLSSRLLAAVDQRHAGQGGGQHGHRLERLSDSSYIKSSKNGNTIVRFRTNRPHKEE
jgi:hypothetical protein